MIFIDVQKTEKNFIEFKSTWLLSLPSSVRFTAALVSCRSLGSCTRWTLTCWAGGSVRGSCRLGVLMDDLRRWEIRLCYKEEEQPQQSSHLNTAPVCVFSAPRSCQMCVTRGGCWLHWRSSAGLTGSTRPSCGGSSWPVRTMRWEVLLTDRETWWAVETVLLTIFSFSVSSLSVYRSSSSPSGGSVPHTVRNRRSLPPGGRPDQAGQPGAVYAWGRPAEERGATRHPQLTNTLTPSVRLYTLMNTCCPA